MSQPMNMNCSLEAKGAIDTGAGEFWVKNPFEMLNGKHNFSAYESNKFLLNRRGKSFVDLSYESGTDIDSDSRGVITADFDRDGDMDLLVSNVGGGPIRLFLNEIPANNQRVRVRLNAGPHNRNAIGARVAASVGGETIIRDVFPVNGFMGQAPAELILGVGTAEKIDRLTVRWPDGESQTLQGVDVGGVLQIQYMSDQITFERDVWK